MKSLTNQEYIQLIEKLVEQQYGEKEEPVVPDDPIWVPADPEIKKKFKGPIQTCIDVSSIKNDKLKDIVLDYNNLIIGPFKICISKGFSQTNNSNNVCLCIYEDKTSSMTYKVDVLNDTRFEGRPWRKYFTAFKRANHISIDELVDIIKWLKAIHKLTCFL